MAEELFYRKLFRNVVFAFLSIFIVVGATGGCSDNNGSGDGGFSSTAIHGVILGEHPEEGLEALQNAMDISEHTGEPNHIHIWGPGISGITDEEIVLIREAFDAEFVISVYQTDAAVISYLYNVILGIDNVLEEVEDIENTDPGEEVNTFSIEKHGDIIWTSKTHSDFTDFKDFEGTIVGGDPTLGLNDFIHHAYHKRDWIEDYQDRRNELMDEGFLDGDVAAMMRKKGLEDELDHINEQIGATTKNTEFMGADGDDLFSLATAHIQTNIRYIGFTASEAITGGNSPDATHFNVYAITNKVWSVSSNDGPDGAVVFLLVEQSLNLASANGYDESDEKPAPDGKPTQQAWVLREFRNSNTLEIGGDEVDFREANLVEHSPPTNQAETASVTTSVESSLGAEVGFDSSGGGASVSGSFSWSTSTSFEKADVSIDNLSFGGRPELANDATFRYRPRMPEIFDDKCNNSMINLADLSRATFQPAQAMVWRIDGADADRTLALKTTTNLTLRNAYIGSCNVFGCKCDVVNQDSTRSQKTFRHYIHLPALP